MNIHNINVIARYEVKLLKRSWLFRIFSVLALLGITVTMMNMQTKLLPGAQYREQWNMIALSSMMPFFCTYIYNITQSIIVIFLAGSFLKRDKKLDTAEVIYVRPMSNADYIIGKTWGILRVFIPLNVIMLLITAFLNVIINHSPFSVYPYLFYLFTISIPSLIFVLGLSYVLTCLLKNQAVTLIVMLGIIGTTFFYLENTLHGVFDFFGVSTPSIFSDVTGLGNTFLFLLQRLIYLLLGIGLITFTISLVKRLPQRPWKTIIVNIIGSILLIAGCCAGGLYVFHFQHVSDLREKYISVYGEYASQKKVHILSQDITLEQEGEKLNAESVIKIRNNQNVKLDQILFYLNPSLEISSIETDGTPLTFKRNEQVCIIDKSIEPGEELSLTMKYHGGINENICYTDIKENVFFDTKVTGKYHRFGKRYAWLEKNYTLLTPECLWYPVSIPPVNPQAPYNIGKNFSNYTLTVLNPNKKVVLSQGSSTESEGKITFTNATPLTGISVTMGDYEIKSITMDSTSYEIYYFKGHDFFSERFKEIGDTLPSILADHKNNTEINYGQDYPFSKIVLAETPIQFATYIRNWKGYTENIQPEIIFIPERMATISFDLDVMKGHVRNSRGRNEGEKSELEQEIQLLDWFLISVFKNETTSEGDWNNQVVNKFYIHPLFFGHVNFIRSEEYPIFDIAFNTMQNSTTLMRSGGWVINNQQRANLYLENNSFKTAMEDVEIKPEIFYELLKLKSNTFKNYIYSQIPQEAFLDFLKLFSLEHSFTEVPFETLSQVIAEEFDLDLSGFISKWYTEDHSPVLYIRNVDANQVVIEEITRYQIKFRINNPSDVDAVITAQARTGGGGGGRRGGGGGGGTPSEPYNYVIPAGSAREIKIITDDRPSGLAINTNISRNLPTLYSYNFSKISTTISDTMSGIFPIDTAVFSASSNEIIIDNEDPGFRTISSNTKHTLKDMFKKEDKDKYLNFPWDLSTQWKSYAADYFYGETVHSAVAKRKGSGANSVEWKAEIPESGYYEIAIWNPKTNQFRRFSDGGNRDERIQTYTVKYEDNQENISLDLEKEKEEWVSIGNFDLPKGPVTITLTDKISGSHYVVADAVKFTPVKN